ncbi:MAG: cell division ATP-binding protein FtsE [Alphaproteobacteria bacterium]|nr:cell division ATP-binding protein FtsE [Alphaproteobacteria bacterium]
MVRFENVGMRYGLGPEVLQDISFTLEQGSFHFLTGASGAGKSSLLRLLYLEHRPSRGLVNVFGEDVVSANRGILSALRRQIGVVFQDFRLLDHLTARDNVALPLRVAGTRESEIASPVEELLDWVGLGDRMNDYPLTLSGGEKQRLAIARAVVRRPMLLVADEPTGNVDAVNGERLMRLFEALNELNTSVVIATHDESLVRKRGHPRLHLSDGRLVTGGS